jgi:hypothetical protein
MAEDQANRDNWPIHVIKQRNVEAAIWERRGDDGRVSHHVTLTKSYNAGDGWKRNATFSMKELSAAITCGDKAQQWILSRQQDLARDQAQGHEAQAPPRSHQRRPNEIDKILDNQPGRPSQLDKLLDKIEERLEQRKRGGHSL